ncbi:hypothetical protein C8R43DRAFT_1124574 [Mycena crocata]|nr:hypothetical protein C8R43DRAFT_1124574 [Mycena crocata]
MVVIRKPSAYATRNPGKPVQPSRKRGKGDAADGTAALNAAERLRNKIKYEAAVDDFWEYRAAEITRIAKECHKSEKVVRAMICNSSLWKPTRRPGLKNAVVHDRSVKAKEAGVDPRECTLPILQQQLQEEVEDGNYEDFAAWAKASIDDTEKMRLIDALVEYRALVARGVRGSRKAAATDGRQTASRIGDELMDLFERTGIRGVAFFFPWPP